MEGIYFYWIAWVAWIYTTFILNKTKARTVAAIFLLIFIITSNKHVEIWSLTINSSIVVSLVGGYFLLSHIKSLILAYYLFISTMLTSAYVAFKLFQIYDPVWVMFHPTFNLALILVLLTLLLVKNQKIRVAIFLICVAQGEIIYTIFLNSLVTKMEIGQMESLDIIAITILASFIWYSFENLVAKLDRFVKNKTVVSELK